MEGNYATRNTHKEDHDSFGFEKHTWGTSSWPARNYSCSFCKKEFRSAQALGGHMNVHRRDRARLRTSLITSPTSWLSDSSKLPNPTINPNNNPNTHLSSPSSPISSYLYADARNNNNNNRSPLYSPCLTLSSYSSLSLPPASISGDKKPRLAPQVPLLSPQSRETKMICNTRSGLGVEGLKGCAVDDEHKVFKNNYEHNITLELGIGLLKHPINDKLDLELRLGH